MVRKLDKENPPKKNNAPPPPKKSKPKNPSGSYRSSFPKDTLGYTFVS